MRYVIGNRVQNSDSADTVHRPEFVRHASKHSFRHGNRSDGQDERWNQRSVQQFLDLLEIDFNATSGTEIMRVEEACRSETTLLFTAFAGSSLSEHLWQYFSLIAIQNSLMSATSRQRIEFVITGTALTELSQLFVRVPYEVIDLDTIRCYYIPAACILNSNTHIDIATEKNQLYILNNQAIRFEEILSVPWQQQKQFFNFRPETLNTVHDLLKELRHRAKLYGDEDDVNGLQVVGIHVREDVQLPFEYYYRAITFQRKMHDSGMLLFVVVCENPKGAVCDMLNTQNERIEVIAEHDEPDVDFVLMMLCNHTIVSNERDIFPPLLRGIGNNVVFGKENADSQYGIELANYLENWYIIV
ncbi:uncharacterized protein LOC118512135 isoform X1 [Anopheles stephensi]|uniref:uncharacterized protein LOC118512135 isoform X1 n=1 Tax=Anopheles stephensi TaxID=30069 RepID=UPI0016587408|nr:uncharacterized protein LOC118512135 isoform X1 [Anopheles stephensi]